MIIYTESRSPYMRIDHYGRETRRAGEGYWCSNRTKRNQDGVVLQYLHHGALELRRAGRVHLCRAGEAVLLLNGEESDYGLPAGAREDCRHQWVELRGPGVQEHWRLMLEAHGPIVRDHPAGELLSRLNALTALAPAAQEADPLEAALAVYRFILFLHRHLAEQTEARSSPVREALARLAENPLHPWSLKELAREAGCSRDHLTRVFQEQFGRPPKAWLNERRTEQALILLESTVLPVAAIARQAGLGSAHALARLVRDRTGLSPRAYRRQAGEG